MCNPMIRNLMMSTEASAPAGPLAGGEQVRLAPEGRPPIEGVVHYATPDFLGVRTSDGGYRLIAATPLV
jgi:hypothetical protein